MINNNKPRVFSGIQPSGNLHIGNFLGAISQWVEMQDEYDCIFCVVDYHAITVKQDPQVLRQKIIEVAKIYLASGIDPARAVIFQQSHITAHTEMAWILNCIARISDLNKMTQFKEKAADHKETASVGLYDYPVLMAADILLYLTEVVPVGEDQTQHVEIARTLARRFNREYGDVFREPDVKIRPETARIMGLDDPTKKMSKSAQSEYNYIALTDDPDKAAKKIMKAVTDSGSEIVYDPDKRAAISNLIAIYSLLARRPIKAIEKDFTGKGYGDFKKALANAVRNFLIDFQKVYNGYSDADVERILEQGADKIRPIAADTLRRVKEKIGVL